MSHKIYDGQYVSLAVSDDRLVITARKYPLDESGPVHIAMTKEAVKSVLPVLMEWSRNAEAVRCRQFILGNGLPFETDDDNGPVYYSNGGFWLDTPDGPVGLNDGDWITRSPDGQFYVNTIL